MAGQIPGGQDDAPDLAIAELSEETTPPLCSLRRWLWVWDRRQWPPQPFGHNFSPLLCALFAILFATTRVRSRWAARTNAPVTAAACSRPLDLCTARAIQGLPASIAPRLPHGRHLLRRLASVSKGHYVAT